MANWKNVPSIPTRNLVLVSNISPAADDKIEFFDFCGKIVSMELISEDDGKVALIMFEKEQAAKTACMLSQALILDRQININLYFDSSNTDSSEGEAETFRENATNQEEKPRLSIVAEIMAAGFVLSDTIIEKARALDQQYKLSDRLKDVYEKLKLEALKINEKYSVAAKAQELDQRFHVTETAGKAANTVVQIGSKALQTEAGRKVKAAVEEVSKTVVGVAFASRELANEKRGKPKTGNEDAPSIDAVPPKQ